MYEYRISREEKEKWCSIPLDQLEGHPDSKIKLILQDTRPQVAELVGNMMADELIANNVAGKITKWVLPSGPEDQYKTFIRRVNEERISLKNLYVFHIDEILVLIRRKIIPKVARVGCWPGSMEKSTQS